MGSSSKGVIRIEGPIAMMSAGRGIDFGMNIYFNVIFKNKHHFEIKTLLDVGTGF